MAVVSSFKSAPARTNSALLQKAHVTKHMHQFKKNLLHRLKLGVWLSRFDSIAPSGARSQPQ